MVRSEKGGLFFAAAQQFEKALLLLVFVTFPLFYACGQSCRLLSYSQTGIDLSAPSLIFLCLLLRSDLKKQVLFLYSSMRNDLKRWVIFSFGSLKNGFLRSTPFELV